MTVAAAPIPGVSLARAQCLRAIDKRFGWLKDEVVKKNGSIDGLPPHMRLLWYARQKVLTRYQKIALYETRDKQDRAYQKLEKELLRRRA